MKSCCYCKHGVEDNQGTECGINWEALEYETAKNRQAVYDTCNAANVEAKGRAAMKKGA